MSSKIFNNTKINVEFDEDYQPRTNINSGENISSLFAKIRRFLLDLKSVAFSGSYNDLSDTPDVVTKEYVDPVKSQAAINRTTLGVQCKNLCNVTYTTRKVHTVNITVNSDKSLGLLTDSTTSIVCVEILTPLIRLYANVTYILTGTNNGDIRIELRDSSKSNILVYDSGSGVEYTPNKDIDVYVCLRIEKSISITSSVTVYPMLRIKGTDDTYEPYKESIDERITNNVSDIAINKSTLGYQRKNLFDWKNAVAAKSGGVTFNKTDNDISVTSSGAWASVAYKLPDLEIGVKYTFSATVSNLSKVASTIKMRLSYSSGGGSPITDIDLTDNGEYKASFIPTRSTVYVLFYPNFSNDVYTNSFTASDIMLRYTDILDDTYEPYQPSLKEQVPYSISLPSKSTSESYSYNGVPTMICLTPSESVSSGGGLYLINSVGTAVYLIDKTGIVINTDTTNKTFTITNNTASTYDVYISCAYKKE